MIGRGVWMMGRGVDDGEGTVGGVVCGWAQELAFHGGRASQFILN